MAKPTTEDVEKLAALARIQISREKLESFTKEFDTILDYVGQLEKMQLPKDLREKPVLRNVFRKDENAYESGTFTKTLVDAFLEKEGNELSVKQIIQND